jgi:hypothetical protein
MKNYSGFAPIIAIVLIAAASLGLFVISKNFGIQKIETSLPPNPTPLASLSPSPTPTSTLTVKVSPVPLAKATLTPTTTPFKTATPRPISVSGYAYEDRNDNGNLDSDDTKLPNMQLYFYDSREPSRVINTVFTDSNGNFATTLNVLGNLTLTPSTYNNFRPRGGSITFSANTSGISIGFRSASAPVPNQVGILEGNIFLDSNRNNTRDSGEASHYFYKLYLQDDSGNYYNTVEGAQTTDAGGHFKYENLPVGRVFKIRLSNPSYQLNQSEYSFSLSANRTEIKDIEIPVYR